MIYTEVVVLTGGGPGNATTFLSIDLVKMALGQFDLGPAAAMSLIYFLVIMFSSWLFYTLMMRKEEKMRLRYLVPFIYILFLMLPIYWLLNMSFKTTNEILGQFTLWPEELHLRQLREDFHRPDMGTGVTSIRLFMC